MLDTDEATVTFGRGTDAAADRLVDTATEHDVDAIVVEHGDIEPYDGIPALRTAIDDRS